MSDATQDAMTVTMDRQGRIVVPKAIREESGIEPGTPLRVSVHDGRIELEPVYAETRVVRKDGFLVAEHVDPGPVLTTERVRRTLRAIQEGRGE